MIFKFALLLLIGASFALSENFGLNVEIAEAPEETVIEENSLSTDDLCATLKCAQGEQCDFTDIVPRCKCIDECETPEDQRLKICSTSNHTFDSECHFYREKCWCKNQDNKCSVPTVATDSLDYYGACQFIDSCSAEQSEVFPNRIKVWLDEVLTILNDRHDLDTKKYGHLVSMANKMKKEKVEKYWTCGVVFEFCQLDKSNDGLIEIDELSALIAPIKSLENCIQPFLQNCDKNKDEKISDVEWAECLDLSDDDLKLLRTVCKP